MEETKPVVFLPLNDFRAVYPKDVGDSYLGRGTFGEVYSSGEFAVKVSICTKDIDKHAIMELGFLTMVDHPCILRPIAWSFNPFYAPDKTAVLMAMPKAQKIVDALKEGKITIEEIVSDTMSAAEYLNLQGIAHCDYKPQNMVYHDGKAKLIDFGLARRLEWLNDNQKYIKGFGYTPVYKDPEYYYDQDNSVKCEIYSLAKTYHDLTSVERHTLFNMYSFKSDIPHLDWLFTEAKKPISERMPIEEIMRRAPPELIVRRHVGKPLIRQTPVPALCCDRNVMEVMNYMVAVIGHRKRIKAQVIFFALHLFHRVLPVLIPDRSEVPNANAEKIALIGAACTYIAISFHVPSSNCPDFCEIFGLFMPGEWSIEQLWPYYIKVVTAANGMVDMETYWHVASCAEDLMDLLKDTITCKYTPFLCRKLIHSTVSRDIFASKLSSEWKVVKVDDLVVDMRKIPPYVEDSKIRPTACGPFYNYYPIKKLWEEFIANANAWKALTPDQKADNPELRPSVDQDMIAVLLKNRDHLHVLEASLSRDIFLVLFTTKWAPTVIPRLINFDHTIPGVLRIITERKLHPFTAKPEDFI
jgi:serine/threonine protein kinase